MSKSNDSPKKSKRPSVIALEGKGIVSSNKVAFSAGCVSGLKSEAAGCVSGSKSEAKQPHKEFHESTTENPQNGQDEIAGGVDTQSQGKYFSFPTYAHSDENQSTEVMRISLHHLKL